MIIYLKRFVYISDPHPQARKIETEITFELDNLDISRLTTEGSQPPGAYSLVGTIQVEFSTHIFTYYKYLAFWWYTFWSLHFICIGPNFKRMDSI